ncbi:amidase family protein [Actinomadura sp. NTSP31]|uniref:amidase family protein n=1 Tax=Actinomadura sp. NTSP31 TaxID=1735447 RepID=UPI0035C0B743
MVGGPSRAVLRRAPGTDMAGSIRIPSAFCGVTGLMPMFGPGAEVGRGAARLQPRPC